MSPFTCLGGAYAYRKSCPTPSLQFSVFLTIFCEKHKDYKRLVGILIGSVGILIFSVGILILSVGILILSVGILIFVVGIMKLLRNCRDYDCRDFDCRDSDIDPIFGAGRANGRTKVF